MRDGRLAYLERRDGVDLPVRRAILVDYVQPFVLAVCASALGYIDAALSRCEAAVAGRDMLFALLHRWWPDLEPVRSDARFADMVGRFNSQGLR